MESNNRPDKELESRLEELKMLAERDLGYHRRVRRRRTFSPGTEVQSQVRPGDREKVLEWLFEVFTEQSWPLDAFCAAVQIMDKFLDICCHILRGQLQLLAVVCANLAGKTRRCPDFASWERKLRVYADHSVTAKEVQAWEMLVLSKLRWSLPPVTAAEYVGALLPFFPIDRDPSSVESDALLMLALCLRSTPLPSSPSSSPPSSSLAPSLRCQTLSSLHLATCQSPKGKEEQKMGKNESRAAAALRLDLAQVEGCAARMETLLLQKTTKPKTHLPHHSTSSTTPPSVPPSAHSPPPQVSSNPTASPFKVTSSSTPKKEKNQQQHAKISPKGDQPGRRKLIDIIAVDNKENNDSAIGSDLGNVTRSDNGSPKSTSSGSSSSKSSPDSGTSAVSRLEGVERALENVRISPLAEQQKK